MKKYTVTFTTSIEADNPHEALRRAHSGRFAASVTQPMRIDACATHETYHLYVKEQIGRALIDLLESADEPVDIREAYETLVRSYELPIELENHQL